MQTPTGKRGRRRKKRGRKQNEVKGKEKRRRRTKKRVLAEKNAQKEEEGEGALSVFLAPGPLESGGEEEEEEENRASLFRDGGELFLSHVDARKKRHRKCRLCQFVNFLLMACFNVQIKMHTSVHVV